MKWIGQHIWQFISRFRSDVYLENISIEESDNIVTINPDTGKLSHEAKSTYAMRGIDDTPVNGVTTESISSNWAYDHSAATGNGAHVPAAGSSGQFLQYNGTWATPPDTNTQLTLIDSDVMSGATASNVASAESTKAYVDAKYSYQYFHFSFKAGSYVSETWVTPSQNGPEYYVWNNSHSTGGSPEPASHTPVNTSVGSSTIEIDYLDQPSAFVVPLSCKLDGFYGNCRTNNTTPNTARPVIGLFRAAEPSDSNNSDVTATCVAIDKYDTSTGNRKNRFLKLETSGLNTDLAQGDLLFPAVGLDEAMSDTNGAVWGSFTIVLKSLIT